jgi:hypothetical protein
MKTGFFEGNTSLIGKPVDPMQEQNNLTAFTAVLIDKSGFLCLNSLPENLFYFIFSFLKNALFQPGL